MDDRALGLKVLERHIGGPVVFAHEVGGDDHGAAAAAGVAMDENCAAGGALGGDKIDLGAEPVERGGGSGVGNGGPLVDVGAVGVVTFAKVEGGGGLRRRGGGAAANVEAGFDEGGVEGRGGGLREGDKQRARERGEQGGKKRRCENAFTRGHGVAVVSGTGTGDAGVAQGL